jgi:hypothetical protein
MALRGALLSAMLAAVFLIGLGSGSPAGAATCTATSDCTGCGGSGGGGWHPMCGAGGPNQVVCRDGNCNQCAECCTYPPTYAACSCARCTTYQFCSACAGSFAESDLEAAALKNQVVQVAGSDVSHPLRLEVLAPSESLVVEQARLEEDKNIGASQIAVAVRNVSGSPITAYAVSWELVGGRGTRPITFSSTFETWGIGEAIQPGESRAAPQTIGAQGKRIRAAKAEITFVEFADGSRTGRAAKVVGNAFDESREQTAGALRSFATTFRESGIDGLKARLDLEIAQGPVANCDRNRNGAALRLRAFLTERSAEEAARLLERY